MHFDNDIIYPTLLPSHTIVTLNTSLFLYIMSENARMIRKTSECIDRQMVHDRTNEGLVLWTDKLCYDRMNNNNNNK